MIRYKAFSALLALLMTSVAAYAADTTAARSDMEGKSIDTILSEIRSEQGTGSSDRIDPNKVSDTLLEQLGEAWMDVQFPDPREHELMDEMMGGAGSTGLAAMHRMMGYRYLTGASGYARRGGAQRGGVRRDGVRRDAMMGPVMGPSMMGYGTDPRVPDTRQRGGLYRIGVWWMVVIVILGVVIVATILLSVGLSRRSLRHWPESPHLDILKRRYARGEISKKEFDDMKRDISK